MMQMLCVAGAFAPVSALFSNLIITRGHSTTYMWCTIVFCLSQLAAALIASPYGINTMIVVYVANNICWIPIWHHYAHREIDLKLYEVVKDISPYLFLATAYVVVAILLTLDVTNLYLSLIIKVVTVSILYALSLWILKSTIFKEFIQFITKRQISEE